MALPQPVDPDAWPSATWPLGAHHDPGTGTTTFAVHAPDALGVLLEFHHAATGSDADADVRPARGADGVWRCRVSGAGPGTLYGYRCWGENWPPTADWRRGGGTAGFRADRDPRSNHFNPNKVLLDPYAREITHPPHGPAVIAAGADPGAFVTGPVPWRGRPGREVDTGRFAPKAVVVLDDTGTGTPPRLPDTDAVIYEAHVKNLTLHPSAARLGDLLAHTPGFEGLPNVPDAVRGTYAGAGLLAPYLRALGVTALELMPVHETDSDADGPRPAFTNHWGYQTLGFFAPNRDYAADQSPGGPTREFRTMVRHFHEEGIEVYLDVVYNHSAEGGNWGSVDAAAFTSLGGFATAQYYVLTADGSLVDGATGTSNQLNFSSPASQRLVLDSLVHWHDVMGVDGFRFDLAPVLGRRPDAAERDDWDNQKRFFAQHPLLQEVVRLSRRRRIEVIAEAWDLWGYEVGNFPSGWGEWNGRFRDAMRRFLRGEGNTDDFMAFFNGDWLHYNDQGGPQRSVNFMTAHDGFTMTDLVSYQHKLNGQPLPFGPSDGGLDENHSWDSRGEHALRRQRWRNFWLVVFLARGIPLVVSGDEYGRTQNGNNNPWNLNTVGLWNNWAQAASPAPTRVPVDPDDPAPAYHDNLSRAAGPDGINPLLVFARHVARLRAAQPTFRQPVWGDTQLGGTDVSYVYFGTALHRAPQPGDRRLAVAIDGGASGGRDYWILVNMAEEPARFDLSEWTDRDDGHEWRRIIDTADWAEPLCNVWDYEAADTIEGDYLVHPWSIAVLEAPAVAIGGDVGTLWGRPHGVRVERGRPRTEPRSTPPD